MSAEEMALIRPEPGGFFTSVSELWGAREIVRAFASRHVRVKYSQTAFGVLWAVVQPLALLAPFAIFFGRVAKVSGGGAPYPAFALSALIPWQFVTNGVSIGANAVVSEGGLLRKVYFPREAPVVGLIGAVVLDLLIGLVLGVPVAIALGGRATMWLFLLPLLCAALLLPVAALALPLAAVNVYYRDFRYGLPLALQVWMFVSPVVFPATQVSQDLRPWYAALNPVVGQLEAFRRVVSLGEQPDWMLLGISVLSSLFLLVLGFGLFKRLEPSLSDIV